LNLLNPLNPQSRLHALDAVRGFALLAGVVLHATMSFLPGFGAIGWPIVDRSPSTAAAVTFFVIHIFRMTTFFMIAGFFAHLLYHRRGPRAFAKNRALRIVVPLVVGWIVVFPMITVAFVWAATSSSAPAAAAVPLPPAPLLAFPLTHLWFLYVLVLLYAITMVLRPAMGWLDAQGTLRRLIDRGISAVVRWGIAPVVLAVPVFIVLSMDPQWRRWFGITTPDQSLIPNLPATMAFTTAFAFGWLAHRQPDLLKSWQRQWALHLSVAIAVTVACLSIAGTTPDFATPPADRSTTIYAALYAIGSWSWTFAVIGIALRFFADDSPVRRYVSDASYWVYIMHLPLVFLLQAAVMTLPWHWSIKLVVILTGTLSLLFASYHVMVRRTFIGEVLNGTRQKAATPDEPATIEGEPSRPPAELLGARKRFGNTVALDGVDLAVRPGELLAVLGPNGAGKSTAISLMLGLLDPDEGDARLFGRSPHDVDARHGVGVMMQEVALSPELKVRELIDLTTRFYPAPLTVEESMRLTNTAGLANRPYGKLSTGQKRQVQFAIAVCGRPAMLFLDEPTVGLDVQARETLWATIRQLLAGGVSIVLTTHYLEEAEALADRVVVLAKGRIIATGSVNEMRALVDRKRVRCLTAVPLDQIRSWSGVASAEPDGDHVAIVATDADAVVRRLMATDATARDLEVRRAGLAEAFAALTQEAA
jgi:ABC-type multidrug transport system ATPase subunit/peptidoglycan/LPS O-acetylase OafA/YrhL